MKAGSSTDQPGWAELSTGQRIRSLEVEGYVVLPGTLDAQTVARLKAQASPWDPTAVHYSPHQRTQSDVQFAGGSVTELIAHAPLIEFLRAALGPDLVFMHAHYAISAPGHPGMNLHTDSHPYGTSDWGYAFSAPRQVRVLYYLDDLTPDVAPLRVVPRSHLSMHPDAQSVQALSLAPRRGRGHRAGRHGGRDQPGPVPRQRPQHRHTSARDDRALIPSGLVRPDRAGPGPLA